MRKALRALAVLAAALPAGAAVGETLRIDHVSPGCAGGGGRTVLEASLPASSAALSLRVYFRGSSEGEELYLEMRETAGGRYQVVLPRPSAGVETISYRFVSRPVSGGEATSSVFAVPVDSSCATAALSESQLRYAENLVLGRTGEGGVGEFECDGVVAQIAANGDLAQSSCEEMKTASSETGPAPVSLAARSGLTRVAPTDRARRVVSRSRP